MLTFFRRRQEADQGFAVLQEAEAAARLKVSDLLENIARSGQSSVPANVR
jgi:hypothetical protein